MLEDNTSDMTEEEEDDGLCLSGLKVNVRRQDSSKAVEVYLGRFGSHIDTFYSNSKILFLNSISKF